MLLEILGETIEFENSESSVELIINTIEEKLSSSELFFSHLIIDGINIYEDYEDYLQDHISIINNIKVECMLFSEFLQEVLLTADDYITNAIPAIENLADALYSQEKSEIWQEINSLIEGIQWLMGTFTMIDSLPDLDSLVNDYEEWNLYSLALMELQEVAINLNEPLTSENYVNASDIILHEIKPAMEKVKDTIPSIAK